MIEYTAVMLSCIVAQIPYGVAAMIGAIINHLTLDWARLRSRKSPVTEAIRMGHLLSQN